MLLGEETDSQKACDCNNVYVRTEILYYTYTHEAAKVITTRLYLRLKKKDKEKSRYWKKKIYFFFPNFYAFPK